MEDDDIEPDDLFREPNDNAYLKKEVRVGPPLEYGVRYLNPIYRRQQAAGMLGRHESTSLSLAA